MTEIFKHAGPFLSVYIDVSRDTEVADKQLETRWKDLRREALNQGAPQSVTDRVGERVLEPSGSGGRNARFLIATEAQVLFDDIVSSPPHGQFATWSALPDVGAWLVDRQDEASVLVVVADHAGADLTLHRRWPDGPVEESSVEGSTEHLHKVRHPRVSGRYDTSVGRVSGERLRDDVQRSTEETWRHNARQVATEIDRRASEARIVVLAGDPGACAGIQQELGPTAAERTVIARGSRAAGAAEQPLDDDVEQAVQDTVAADRTTVLEDYERRRAQGHGVAAGIRDVLAASVQGQVETVLFDPGTAASHRFRPQAIAGLTLPSDTDADDALRADQLAVAAGLRTGADIALAEPALLPPDGVAALLRWDT